MNRPEFAVVDRLENIFPVAFKLPKILSPSFLVLKGASAYLENIFSGLDLAKSPKSSAGFFTDLRLLLYYSFGFVC